MPHDPRRYDNPGHPPTKWPADTPLGIEFACGHVALRPYTRDQLVWEIRGWAFDIVRFWRA